VFKALLKKIAEQLEKAGIPYMVIGGQAVLVYGEPRLTKDIDITVGIDVDEIGKIINVTKKLGFKNLVVNVEDFARKTMVLPVVDQKSGIRIDIVFSFSPYEMQALERTTLVKFGKTTVRFASLEDVVIHKIIAGRPRDIEDVKSILLKNKNYDRQYILKWLKEFDLSLSENYSDTFKDIIKDLPS
jgi:predicted nucleotidyltransferase